MRTFTINGKEYKARPFDFGLICDLEDYGIGMDTLFNRGASLIRAYFAICAGRSKEYANAELQAHIVNKGTFTELNEVMRVELEEADFFRAMQEQEVEATTTESAPKKKTTSR